MTLFGHTLSITVVLQLIASAIVLGLYALSESMQEQKAKLQSDRNMAFLVAFLVHHHPAITSVAKLEEITWGKASAPGAKASFFAMSMQKFIDSGTLPEADESAKTSLLKHFISLVYVAIFALPSSIGLLLNPSIYGYQLDHTVYRKVMASRMMTILSANVFLAFLVAEFLLQRHPILCAILLLNPFFVFVQCLIVFTMTVKEQQSWKDFWSNRLMEIMAIAARDENHDLFNRALFLKNDVDSQPDLPIPGKLSLYTTIYSVVQVTILFFSKALHLG
jgi:hypothetical protein